MERKAVFGTCPLCDEFYSVENNRTKHHIFPCYWKKRGVFGKTINVTVYACHRCHEVEFNKLYPMELKYPWTKMTCLLNWVEFCSIKGKNAFVEYPQLKKLKV